MKEFAFGQTQEQFANFERARQQEAPRSFTSKPRNVPEEDNAQSITHIRTMINNIYLSAPSQEDRPVHQSSQMDMALPVRQSAVHLLSWLCCLLRQGKGFSAKAEPYLVNNHLCSFMQVV